VQKARVAAVDASRCTGCELCRLVCSFKKEGKFDPGRSRIAVAQDDGGGFAPRVCHNCGEPPCVDACPAGAIRKRKEDGRVVLLNDKCQGCNMCVMVCPFNAIAWRGGSCHACDGCEGAEGCAEICPPGAVRFVALNAESRRKRKDLAARLTGLSRGP